MRRDSTIIHQRDDSGKFLPAGASEESAGKVPKGERVPPEKSSREIRRGGNRASRGQFREISSAGGVGRKFEERAAYILRFHRRYAEARIDHQRSVPGSFFMRGRRKKVPGRFQRQAHTRKVPKASAELE